LGRPNGPTSWDHWRKSDAVLKRNRHIQEDQENRLLMKTNVIQAVKKRQYRACCDAMRANFGVGQTLATAPPLKTR
jgi:hypothetical protein